MTKRANTINIPVFLSSCLRLDQQVVYNFLEKINHNQEKEIDRSLESAQGKSLDDILNNLKK